MEKKRGLRTSEESFVIRIGTDEPRPAPHRWLATIVHVATGERRYVRSYDELWAFIESRRRRSHPAPD
jgi:hypothetical protein